MSYDCNLIWMKMKYEFCNCEVNQPSLLIVISIVTWTDQLKYQINIEWNLCFQIIH